MLGRPADGSVGAKMAVVADLAGFGKGGLLLELGEACFAVVRWLFGDRGHSQRDVCGQAGVDAELVEFLRGPGTGGGEIVGARHRGGGLGSRGDRADGVCGGRIYGLEEGLGRRGSEGFHVGGGAAGRWAGRTEVGGLLCGDDAVCGGGELEFGGLRRGDSV